MNLKTAKIKNITKIGTRNVINLTVNKNHTFITENGIITHNCDYLSIQAQGILRMALEEYSENARFILTCNYENKIIPAIKSRCQHFHFKNPPKDAILERCLNILISEEIEFDPEDVEKLVTVGYPDMRKIINLLQQNTLAGKLTNISSEGSGTSDVKLALLELLKEKKLREARQLVCSQVTTDQFEDIYRFLYLNLDKVFQDINQYEASLVILAKYLYQHQSSADVELNFTALMIEIGRL
jgi:DNA polymerase III delta prime subunit